MDGVVLIGRVLVLFEAIEVHHLVCCYYAFIPLTSRQALLHASLDRSSLSMERFSRWLRAICTILLARGNPTDRFKALGYVEQALAVMGSGGDDPCEENEVCCHYPFHHVNALHSPNTALPNGRTPVALGYII